MFRSRCLLAICWLGFSLTVSSCAGSSLGNSLQKSLEADPQLAQNPPFGTQPSGSQGQAPQTPESTPSSGTTPNASRVPEPGQPDFIGPIQSAGNASTPVETSDPSAPPNRDVAAAELAQVPEELRSYVADLLALNLLTVSPAPNKSTQTSGESTFKPNQTITRSDYAHWLFDINNRFYQNQPDKKIRAGLSSSQPAFKDVPPSHPDYAAIQGLAEAGLIPSALAGNATAVTFRPEDPLTRKDLILWKVPLDTRQALPSATVTAVKESWGFQDASKVEPLAQRALLADYQNGDLSNIRRAFGYTTLFQPEKSVTEAEAAAVLWRFGSQTEGVSAQQIRQGNSSTTTNRGQPSNSQSAGR